MILYRILIIVFSPLIFLHLLWKSIRLKQSRFLFERLGFGIGHIPQHILWFHCASVGEVNAVLPLLYQLRERHPEQNFLVTTNTTTGAEIIARQQQTWLFHSYLPMDWLSTTKRFYNKTKPLGLFIMETELWPNLVNTFYQHRVTVCIINGRLSNKTTNANAWIRLVYATTLQRLTYIYARSDIDKDLYITLGANKDQITTLGNIKFSSYKISPDNLNHTQQVTSRDYVIIASSHENEEQLITESWLKLNRKELLVIAPRHPNRSAHIIKQLTPLSSNIAVRSRNDRVNRETKIYLLDTVGELTGWFSDAKVIVMAGSFTHRGGHNILEPAHFAKAIICGPHMESFVDEMEVMHKHQALLQVNSINELTKQLQYLLDNDDARTQLETNAAAAVAPFNNIISSYANAVETHVNFR